MKISLRPILPVRSEICLSKLSVSVLSCGWTAGMETDFNMKKFRQLSRQCMRIYKMCFKCDIEKYK